MGDGSERCGLRYDPWAAPPNFYTAEAEKLMDEVAMKGVREVYYTGTVRQFRERNGQVSIGVRFDDNKYIDIDPGRLYFQQSELQDTLTWATEINHEERGWIRETPHENTDADCAGLHPARWIALPAIMACARCAMLYTPPRSGNTDQQPR